ncbi:MAG TPA: ornithine cyclodeaminase family protein [Candidatus Polarisedimenticolaceae bacterium]|nr:ornithine cyclodeaminase family protein [Candidatus Polarisedimenticolaceae bacterium]
MNTDLSPAEPQLPAPTLLLTGEDVSELLPVADCIRAVEDALRHHADGRSIPPAVLGIDANRGGFHLKAAGLRLERTWFAVKCNGNFPDNPMRFRLPTIQGLIVLCDGDDGSPLAVIDSAEITSLRTGAATAVAAKHLAREDARDVTICGCGRQGRAQLRALCCVRPLERVFAFDTDGALARRFAEAMAAETGLRVEPVDDLAFAVRQSDVCVTCTPATRYLLEAGDVRPGTFVAGVGADSENKWEIDPLLFGRAKVVVDHLEQCATIGDLHHALDRGTIERGQVHAELAELVAGRRAGRTTDEEITLFDSTGIALEDVGAALAVYRRAVERGGAAGVRFGARPR